MQDEINNLYEELIYLDEIAGELDPESNAKIDARRAEIKQEIQELQSLGTVHVDTVLTPQTNDNWYDEQYEFDDVPF